MLEAVAHHCATVVGPDTRNFPDAMQLLVERHGILQCPDEASAIAALSSLMSDTEQRALAQHGYDAWQQSRGAIHQLDASANATAECFLKRDSWEADAFQ